MKTRLSLFAAALLLAPAPVQALQALHTERSLYRNIFVFEDDGERCMRFRRFYGALRQGCIDLKNPDRLVFDYARMLLGALYLNPNPKKVLVIGLGAGTVPRALERILPGVELDLVEIDPAVVRVAKQFFDFRPGPKTRVVEEDGRVFVKRAGRAGVTYDLVMLDAFDHDYIPEHMLTREFLQEVRAILAPDGVLAANTFSGRRLYHNESVTYEAVYGRFYNLKNNNRVLLLKLDGLPPPEMLARNAALLDAAFRPFGVQSSSLLPLFSLERDWQTGARVLTDKYAPSNLLNTE
jgi:spermidine synthase